MFIKKNLFSKKFDEVSTKFLDAALNGDAFGYIKLPLMLTANNMVAVCLEEVNTANMVGTLMNDDGTPVSPSIFKFNGQECVSDIDVVINNFEEGKLLCEIKERPSTKSTAVVGDYSIKIDEETARLLNVGYSEKEIEDRIDIMKNDNGLSDKMIYKVLAYISRHEGKKPETTYVATDEKHKLSKALASAMGGHAILFEGGKSTGKNVLAKTVAYILGLPYYEITLSADSVKSDVFGGKTTDNSENVNISADTLRDAFDYGYNQNPNLRDAAREAYVFGQLAAKQTHIVLEQSDFVDWMQNGGVMHIAELNYADANFISAILNPLLDGSEFLLVPGRGRVYLNKDCVLLASQNPNYIGCQEQNQATRSRFAVLAFEYPDDMSAAIKAALHDDDVDEDAVKSICKFYSELVKMANQGVISDAVLNIRGFIRALQDYTEYDESLGEYIRLNVTDACPREEQTILQEKLNTFFE